MNEDGYGRIFSFSTGFLSPSPFPPRESLAAAASPPSTVPCAFAGDSLFCPNRSGAVHRSTRGRDVGRVVASSRSGSRVSAALLGDSHTALAYLASRKTTEGWVSEAWLAIDDEAPSRISDDGSGATAVILASRGANVIALSIDARMALTAMHARVVTYDKRLNVGDDTVVFVGGPGDRGTAAALAAPRDGPAWSLLPIAKDVGSFGLALVRLDTPPRVDEPVTWSMYPNGLDPAPVAVAYGNRRLLATRVRPETANPVSRRVLELGEVDGSSGVFSPVQIIPTTGNPTDATLVVDAHDAIWLAWSDAAGGWLEELRCK
ncbi:MAG: hypothetical protein M3O50_06275 [Myxococcota bacterium]|nr:hypothetical protein [Myxococcota bacterium]